MSKDNNLIKCILIGDNKVGKSNIIQRYTHNTFYQNYKSTIGINLSNKFIELNNKTYEFQIFDTSGSNHYQEIIKCSYIGTSCAIVVYDITNRNSFDNVISWIEEYKNKI